MSHVLLGPETPKPDMPPPPDPDEPGPPAPEPQPRPFDPDHPFPSYEDVPPVQPIDVTSSEHRHGQP